LISIKTPWRGCAAFGRPGHQFLELRALGVGVVQLLTIYLLTTDDLKLGHRVGRSLAWVEARAQP
jgi:hypothetical protein